MANEHLASELPPPPIKPPHQSLAPLEYLQSQRRGSVTDPFLHASAQQPHHPPPDQSTPRHSEAYTNPRNGSYAFPPTNGHKTPENSSMNSNLDHPNGGGGGWTAQSGTGAPDQNLDHADPSAGRHGAGSPGRSGPASFPPPFNNKRKMSHDRQGFHYPADDPNGNPAFANYAPHELEGPHPKRRSSTFETNNRIAHMTLQDRRDSVDSRSSLGGASLGGWAGDRRDSGTSMYSATSVASSGPGGYTTGSGGELGKPYGWSSHPSQQPPPQHAQQMDTDNHMQHTPREFAFPQDPSTGPQQGQQTQFALPPAPIIPSVHYGPSAAVARRLSIPESSLPANGKQRNRRGSRNPTTSAAEGAGSSDAAPPTAGQQVSPVPHNAMAAPSGADGQQGNMGASPTYGEDDQGVGGSPRKDTPYSRSPELRVSHKMAERKRRKEMKDLFDELRDQLPADRGMKASKWEILSKAVDYIAQLKVAYTEMSSEIEQLRAEIDTRPGGPSTTQIRRHDFSNPPPVQDLATAPGTPVSAMSPNSASPMNGLATPGSGHGGGSGGGGGSSLYAGDRPGSAQSLSAQRQSSMALTEPGRSPSVSSHPLQQQLTGSAGRVGTPMTQHSTPQQQAGPLPHSSINHNGA